MTSTTRYFTDSDIHGIHMLWAHERGIDTRSKETDEDTDSCIYEALEYTVGDDVEGGETEEDYDTGRIIAIDGDQTTVAWSAGVRTTVPSGTIRARRVSEN